MGPLPTDAQWSALSKCVQSILQRADAEPFRAPVEWKSLGLYDYPQIIKKPMDLGTVKKNIADRKYKTLFEAADDVRLVWTNCKTYNADGSDFFVLAQNLSEKWEDKFKKLCADHNISADGGTGGPSSSSLDKKDATTNSTTSATATTSNTNTTSSSSYGDKISLEDKRSFARSLYKISREDLGRLIVEVDTKCPAALSKNAAEDECELNVDKFPPSLFQELKLFVQGCTKVQPVSSKKKSASGTTTATTTTTTTTTSGATTGSNTGSNKRQKVTN